MVSPACGNRGVTAMRSMFKLPITTIFAMDLAVVGESDQADGCDIQNRHPTQGDPRDPGSFRKFTPYEHAPRGGDQRSRLPNGVGNWNTHETPRRRRRVRPGGDYEVQPSSSLPWTLEVHGWAAS